MGVSMPSWPDIELPYVLCCAAVRYSKVPPTYLT